MATSDVQAPALLKTNAARKPNTVSTRQSWGIPQRLTHHRVDSIPRIAPTATAVVAAIISADLLAEDMQ
jgi:hypothetical protein